MSASEALFTSLQGVVADLAALGPIALATNLGLSALACLTAWGVGIAAKRAIRVGVRRLPGGYTAEKQVRGTRAMRISGWLLRLFLGGWTLLTIAWIWGVDVGAWLSAGLGADLSALILRAGLVVLIGVLAFEAVGFLINNGIGRLADKSSDARRSAQLNSFGPLLRGIGQGAVFVAAALMLLGDFGVRIGPLLAGAGVVGIAVGFGAQTLVRDLLTGIFLLIEDIVAVGDIVRIGDSGGLVEEMTLRTIRLRDFDGTLHVIPYGEAQIVHNLTKTFSYYVFDLQVSYGSDLDAALKIMRETGAALQADTAFQDKILEPIEVVGVDALGDSGVALKARIKTRPIEQWTVGREYNRRIKLAFEAAGIEIAAPRMKLGLPADLAERANGSANYERIQ